MGGEVKTRVFYDTEFRENGRIIDLLSIGMVTDRGACYYAVVSDADWDAVKKDEWLLNNVWPGMPVYGIKYQSYTAGGELRRRVGQAGHLDTSSTLVKPKWVIANEVRDFLASLPNLELWAWYGAYDHVALAQLWGRMVNLPKGIPMWTNDLKQEAERVGNPELPEQTVGVHNALSDAQHNLVRARALGVVTDA